MLRGRFGQVNEDKQVEWNTEGQLGGVEERRSDVNLPVAIGQIFSGRLSPVWHGSVSSSPE
jgi:hypothetical protein